MLLIENIFQFVKLTKVLNSARIVTTIRMPEASEYIFVPILSGSIYILISVEN